MGVCVCMCVCISEVVQLVWWMAHGPRPFNLLAALLPQKHTVESQFHNTKPLNRTRAEGRLWELIKYIFNTLPSTVDV